jgi:hypothetical protein
MRAITFLLGAVISLTGAVAYKAHASEQADGETRSRRIGTEGFRSRTAQWLPGIDLGPFDSADYERQLNAGGSQAPAVLT